MHRHNDTVCVRASQPEQNLSSFLGTAGNFIFHSLGSAYERRKRSDSGARNISACSNKRGADITLWRILTTEVKAQYFSSDSMTIMVIWPPRNVRNEMKRSTE